MALSNTAEGGTNGSTVTTAEAGSGDPWTIVTQSGDGVVAWSNVVPLVGSMSIRIAQRTTSAGQYVGWTASGLAECFGGFTFQFDNFSSSTYLMSLHETEVGFKAFYFRVTSATNQVELRHGNDSAAVWTSGTVISTGTTYRVEYHYIAPPSGTTCQVAVRLFNAADALLESSGLQNVTQSGAFTAAQAVRFGEPDANTNRPSTTGFLYMDRFDAFKLDWPINAQAPNAARSFSTIPVQAQGRNL